MTDPRLESLLQACPRLRVKTDPADLEHYGRDWTRRWAPAPLAIALPATVEEVQAVLRWASEYKVAVVPSGGRTGLSGGAVAANGELVLSLERMNKALDFNAVDRTLTVQAGMPLEALHNAILLGDGERAAFAMDTLIRHIQGNNSYFYSICLSYDILNTALKAMWELGCEVGGFPQVSFGGKAAPSQFV